MSGIPRFISQRGYSENPYAEAFHMRPFYIQSWSTSYTRHYLAQSAQRRIKHLSCVPDAQLSGSRLEKLHALSGCKIMVISNSKRFLTRRRPHHRLRRRWETFIVQQGLL